MKNKSNYNSSGAEYQQRLSTQPANPILGNNAGLDRQSTKFNAYAPLIAAITSFKAALDGCWNEATK